MPLRYKMPTVDTDFFAFEGGLDLVTPSITMPPGRTFDCLNYEPEISGGYRRVNGYERYDGQPSPTDDAKYVVLQCNLTSVVNVGDTVTGSSSGITGMCVAVVPKTSYTLLVLARVDAATQTYQSGESIALGNGIIVGHTIAISGRASDPEDDAYYQYLASNDTRANINAVPGSGPIRGICSIDDDIFVFRDSVDGTTQNLWKAFNTGWVQINLGTEVLFNTGLVEIKAGDTIFNSGHTVSAEVAVVATQTGTWGTTGEQAKGSLILVFNSLGGGNFVIGEQLYVNTTACATVAAPATAITRLGGSTQKMELIKHTFGSKTGPQVVYGCDGLNLAFEFNGSDFIPIRTGMTLDTPNRIAAHLNYLWLAYGSSVQFSEVNNPYSWTPILGAGEFSAGDNVTGLLPMIGGNQAPVMAVFTKSKVAMLYGSGSTDFRLQNSVTDIGYSPGTMQSISGTAFGLTARGMQTLAATQRFGDFQFGSISALIHPLINRMRGKEQCSVVIKNKNQWRVFYGDESGTCLVVGLTGEKVTAIMPLEYGKPVRCVWVDTFSDGVERTFFGSDDGYVYEDNKGTSFDGANIEAWIRLVFNHEKSPRLRKRWRRAVVEAKVDSYCKVNMSYDLGYGNPDVTPPQITDDASLVGGIGGYWDQFTWDEFHWDAQFVLSPSISIEGTEKNIAMIFYSNRAQDSSHTLQGLTIHFTKRRGER